MEALNSFFATLSGIVWGWPTAVLLLSCGVILTFRLGFPQIRGFKHALQIVRGKYDDPSHPGEISHFQTLCSALSGTLGLGNISGVAVAIHNGGPGAAFWMIVCGLIGMATKYAECSLAVMYRKIDAKGTVHGGPMHFINIVLVGEAKTKSARYFWKFMAAFFAVSCIAGCLGAANMFQTNQVATILKDNFGLPGWITGATLAILVGVVILGGIRRIARVAEYLIPFTTAIYFIGALIVILVEWRKIPEMFSVIFQGAFSTTAVGGAAVGIAMKEAFTWGTRRACFSNEAGLGSAAIAHAAVATDEPIREGVVALLEPLIDTVVVCSVTAFVVIISGTWQQGASGIGLTVMAFDQAIPGFGQYFLPVAVFLLAYATLIGWSYYGERATDYLFGERGLTPYRILFCLCAFLGAITTFDLILNFSDVMLAFMAIPNLIAIMILLPRLKTASDSYFTRMNITKSRMSARIKG